MGVEKDFEDDRIIRWRETDAGAASRDLDTDPTLLGVNIETEEIHESRTYALSQDFLRGLAARAGELEPGLPISLLLAGLGELGAGTGFKLLAKRSKENGLVTFAFVIVTRDRRLLLAHENQVPEERYRQFVSEVEPALVGHLTGEPAVITLEEWRRYAPGEQ